MIDDDKMRCGHIRTVNRTEENTNTADKISRLRIDHQRVPSINGSLAEGVYKTTRERFVLRDDE